jgi:hypothetical protein
MMGRLKSDQGQLFYEFCLGDAVPEDHMVRKIDAVLDLSWLRSELTPHYSTMGRPSIDLRGSHNAAVVLVADRAADLIVSLRDSKLTLRNGYRAGWLKGELRPPK